MTDRIASSVENGSLRRKAIMILGGAVLLFALGVALAPTEKVAISSQPAAIRAQAHPEAITVPMIASLGSLPDLPKPKAKPKPARVIPEAAPPPAPNPPPSPRPTPPPPPSPPVEICGESGCGSGGIPIVPGR